MNVEFTLNIMLVADRKNSMPTLHLSVMRCGYSRISLALSFGRIFHFVARAGYILAAGAFATICKVAAYCCICCRYHN